MTSADPPTNDQIFTPKDWADAVAEGRLTGNDVIERLYRMAIHQFGEEGQAGYDEQGFFISLTAAGLRLEGGVTIVVHTRDHPPPHVHLERKGEPDIKFDLATGDLLSDLPRGVKASALRRYQSLIFDNRQLLGGWWQDYHGDPVDFVFPSDDSR